VRYEMYLQLSHWFNGCHLAPAFLFIKYIDVLCFRRRRRWTDHLVEVIAELGDLSF